MSEADEDPEDESQDSHMTSSDDDIHNTDWSQWYGMTLYFYFLFFIF